MTFGSLAGDTGVGTHGGSEDHAAILTGAPSMLSAFAFVPMRRLQDVHVPDDWQFVLSPSGVPSEKTGSSRDKYNRLSEGTRQLLDLWNTGAERAAPSLGAALASSSSARDRLEELIDRSVRPGWPPGALRVRLDHFVREDARVAQAVEAFTRGDVEAVTELAHASQHDAEYLLGNQIPATIDLAAAARRAGAFASCSFGAGFGGSVWALVERAAAPGFATRWRPDAFLAQPGPAMLEL
jgi:galactokinase